MKRLLSLLIVCGTVLPIHAKYSGGTGEPNDPYQIATAADLIALGETPEDYDKHFILTADIDLDPNLPGRKVFDKAVIAPDVSDTPTALFDGTPFTGVIDGTGHTIRHLTIKGKADLGLLGRLEPMGEVRNLGIVDVDVTGAGDYVGGLLGSNSGSVTACYSTGRVSGTSCVGGLVGLNGIAAIVDSYSTASVTGVDSVGGLVGWGGSPFVISVYENLGGILTRCYSAGAVSGTVSSRVGGLIASIGADTDVNDCFWDTETSGQATSAGGTGRTTGL